LQFTEEFCVEGFNIFRTVISQESVRKFVGFIMAETSVPFLRASENDPMMFQTHKLVFSFMNLSPACQVLIVEELC
jgi:hypothetical protein